MTDQRSIRRLTHPLGVHGRAATRAAIILSLVAACDAAVRPRALGTSPRDISASVNGLPAAPSFGDVRGYYLGTTWLFWQNNVAAADSFRIERCETETCAESDFTVIATVGARISSMAYQDWGVTDWTIYTYRLRATNEAGDSEPSNALQGRSCIEEIDWDSPCFPPLPPLVPGFQF